jgi:hypothetical protein
MQETLLNSIVENESKILEISAEEYRDKIFEIFP